MQGVGARRALEIVAPARRSRHLEIDVADVEQSLYVCSTIVLLAEGPTFAHGMTKTMLSQEWSMTIDQAIEAEAQAQAICMQTEDFKRAYEAFSAKRKPVFQGD